MEHRVRSSTPSSRSSILRWSRRYWYINDRGAWARFGFIAEAVDDGKFYLVDPRRYAGGKCGLPYDTLEDALAAYKIMIELDQPVWKKS